MLRLDDEKKRPGDTIKYHNKRVEMLKEIDTYLKKNGPTLCVDVIMDIDILHNTLLKYIRQQFLIAETVSSKKQNGKEKLLTGVNWRKINSVVLPDTMAGKRQRFEKINSLTKNRPLSLRQLSKSAGIPVTTLRYWKNEGWLKTKLYNRQVMVFGCLMKD